MSTNMNQTIADYFKAQPVLKAWLFGSYARGEETPDSDVDILVNYDRSQPIGLMKIANMSIELEDLLGRKVDLVEEKMLLPWVVDSINNDKKLIYARANYQVNPEDVWDVIQHDLIILKEQVQQYLDEIGKEPEQTI